ncbi:MAG: L-serine ammonia-lyase, iron-sulfur-dependent subunit beta [Coriobacteriia bacterium]|nr:L-serine ammonia-lyase, iron-sulfur-dependent subunit beta [Coriobacteriia bacterium]
MPKINSIFDIIGPVMVGPSSSHTAGAVRLGALARNIYGQEPTDATIGLHGSLQATADGHGTKLALIAGLLGMGVDDVNIIRAADIARDRGHHYAFEDIELLDVHPNTARFCLGSGKDTRTIQGSSIGGGNIKVTHIDGYNVAITGTLPALLVFHKDRPGAVAAVTSVLSKQRINIANMQVAREKRGHRALMLIKTDVVPDDETMQLLADLKKISTVTFISPV